MFEQSVTQSASKIIGEFGLPLIGTSAIPATFCMLLAAEAYLLEKKQEKDKSREQTGKLLADYLEHHALQVAVDEDGMASCSVSDIKASLGKRAAIGAGSAAGAAVGAVLGPIGAILGGVIGGVIGVGSGVGAVIGGGTIERPDIIKDGPTQETTTAVQNVVVENKQGTVVYQIQNLHIHLTADFVNQLNINSQEVINNFKDQLRDEISRATALPK